MPLVSINCCEGGFNIKRLFCACRDSSSDDEDRSDQKVMYQNEVDQIIILATPAMRLNDFVPLNNPFEMVTVQPTADQTDVVVVSVSNAQWFGEDMKLKSSDELTGHLVKDVLPNSLSVFMHDVCISTLCGDWLEIVVMRRHTIYLVRTFPTLDPSKKIVLGGQILIAPYDNANVGDITRFALNQRNQRNSSNKVKDSLKQGVGVVGHARAASRMRLTSPVVRTQTDS